MPKKIVNRIKKHLLLPIVILIFATINLNAQNWFIGGNFSLQDTNSTTDTKNLNGSDSEQKDHTNHMSIQPTIGFRMEKSDIGFYPIYRNSTTKITSNYSQQQPTGHYQDLRKENTEAWIFGAGLFYRHDIFNIGNLSVLGRMDLSYNHVTKDTQYSSFLSLTSTNYSTNRIIDSDTKQHTISINITPVFQYKISNRISLFTDLNIRGINFDYSNGIEKITESNETIYELGYPDDEFQTAKRTRKINDLRFNGSTNTSFSITQNFSIGMYIYF